MELSRTRIIGIPIVLTLAILPLFAIFRVLRYKIMHIAEPKSSVSGRNKNYSGAFYLPEQV